MERTERGLGWTPACYHEATRRPVSVVSKRDMPAVPQGETGLRGTAANLGVARSRGGGKQVLINGGSAGGGNNYSHLSLLQYGEELYMGTNTRSLSTITDTERKLVSRS